MFRAQLAHIEDSIKTSHRCTPNQEEVLKHEDRKTVSDLYYDLCSYFASSNRFDEQDLATLLCVQRAARLSNQEASRAHFLGLAIARKKELSAANELVSASTSPTPSAPAPPTPQEPSDYQRPSPPPKPQMGMDTQMDEQKYCIYCGAANPTIALFCAKCGKAFTSASTPQPPSAPPPSTPQEPSDYQRPSPPPKPQRQFESRQARNRRYMLYGVAAVIVLGVVLVVATSSYPNLSSQRVGGSSSNIAVAVNSQQTASQIGSGAFSGTPQAGNQFVIFNVTVTNLNKNNWPLGNPLYFKLTTADKAVYSYSSSTYYLGSNALTLVSNTNPGETVTGQIAFEIPQSATATTLTYNDGLGGGSCTVNLTPASPA